MNIKFTILGCGTSFGVPRIDGYFGKCNRRNKKNYRMRCSALISTKNLNFLIDTSPDIKTQLLNLKVKKINRVFYTHSHADQTHGINELRAFYLKNKKKITIHADKYTKNYLVKSFEYCFKSKYLYPAILEIKKLKKIHTFKDKKKIIIIRSIKVQHGSIKSNCYIVNNKCAYAPDVSRIYTKDVKYFKNIEYLIIDCLRYKEHPSHFNLNDVLNFVKLTKPKKTILTNLNSDIDYNEIKKKIPKNIIPAYDGLSFSI